MSQSSKSANEQEQQPNAASTQYSQKCTICMETIAERGLQRECTVHYYCYPCILWWLQGTKPRCPMCRALITKVAKCKTPAEETDVDWKKLEPIKLAPSVLQNLTDLERLFFEEVYEEAEDESFEVNNDKSSTSSDGSDSDSLADEAVSESENVLKNLDELEGEQDDEDYMEELFHLRRPGTPASLWSDDAPPMFSDHDGTYDDEYGGAIAFSERRGERHLPNFVPKKRKKKDKDYTPDGSEEEPVKRRRKAMTLADKRKQQRRRVMVKTASPVRRAQYVYVDSTTELTSPEASVEDKNDGDFEESSHSSSSSSSSSEEEEVHACAPTTTRRGRQTKAVERFAY